MAPDPSLLFLNQHYWPDVAATGQHLTDLAEHLVTSGFCVRIVCGQAAYGGRERVAAPPRETRNGVEIVRLPVPTFERSAARHRDRIAGYAAFHLRAARQLMRGPRSDLLVSLTTPSFLPFTVRQVCRIRGIRYGIWAMDLHPEVEEALGVLPRSSLVRKPLRSAARSGCRGAGFVVALGRYMADRIRARGVAPGRIHVIPVWSRKDEIFPVSSGENPLRRELGYGPADFVVMYSGNAGLAHRFAEVFCALEALRDREDVHFLFVGGGPRRAEIEREAAERRFPRFRYVDYFPREKLAHSLSVGDLHLLTLREDMAGLVAPSKVYGIMAAGRPALMVGPEESEPAAALLDARAGEVLPPTRDPEVGGAELARRILRMKEDPELRRVMGERARRAFLERFEKEVACRQWEGLLRERVVVEARNTAARVPVRESEPAGPSVRPGR